MKIWLAYVNFPITTAVYLRRALQQAGHSVTTIGPRLPEEAIELWGLQNMRLPLEQLDIDTSFTPDMPAIWESTPEQDRPDIYLWVESVAGYRPQNLEHLPCPKACWLIDTHYHLTTALETARLFDYVFIAQLIDLETFRSALPRSYWLPLACDPAIHGRQDVETRYDIGFVGSMNPRRAEMLDFLAGHFNLHAERSFWTDMARTFSASKIVLNDASFDDLNMRFFEALASGALLLSNRTSNSGQDLLFHDLEEYACHHDHDICEVIQHYLDNDQLRKKVAETGRQRVLAAHTYRHRADDLIQVALCGKNDTFSPLELRQRSISLDHKSTTSPPRIRSIVTTRYRSNWPTWQMVHEWEDILAAALAVQFRPVNESYTQPDPDCPANYFDLIFIQLASELNYYFTNPQLIPIVMDLWRDDFDEFRRNAVFFKLVFVTNLQAYQELCQSLPNLHYLPFSLADQYFNQNLPAKDIDIIQFGRRNPLLERYMQQLLKEFPGINYITTETSEDGKKVHIYSSISGQLGESNSRKTFIELLRRCKISLVSTVGMDGSRNTGGIDPVSPRFLESMAAGCHLVGRIPDNDEFNRTGIYTLCHQVDTYNDFRQTILALLDQNANPSAEYTNILQERLTSSLPARILQGLSTLAGGHNTTPTPEEPMQTTKPALDIENRLHTIKQSYSAITDETAFINYQTLCDVIACYREFHNLDLTRYYTTIIGQQKTPDTTLLFAAIELAGSGDTAAARLVAHRAQQINPVSIQAAILQADMARKNGDVDEARLACLEIQKQGPGFDAAQAVLDMCDIDEALPGKEEHYHLLHQAHQILRPRRYIEIGVSNGKSLSLAKGGTSAIGVDPMTASEELLFFHSPATTPHLFKLTSNDFFQQGRMEQTWGNATFDIAFIDGLHLFEQALMDFINLERRSSPDSIIFIHDCLPVSIAGAERDRSRWVWTGDVWKVVACLKAVRPDLEITTFPVKPSGVAMVRRLDSSSRLLSNQFDLLVKHFMGTILPEQMSERFSLLNVSSTPYANTLNSILNQQGTWQRQSTTI